MYKKRGERRVEKRKKKGMKGKKGMIEFSWIFALVVGIVILFLAFYFIGSKFTERNVVAQYQTENSLDILFNPFSSFGGLGATSSKSVELPREEAIDFSCGLDSGLGYDSVSVKTGALFGPEKKIYDKYLYSENFSDGKNYQIISKPFSMPWRVADLIYFIPKNKIYCFVSFGDIEKEFGEGEDETGMNISNFRFVDNPNKCKDDENQVITVCKVDGCNITVDSQYNQVKKRSSNIVSYYVGDALMYAAIFSDPVIYNCNLKRLAKRIGYQVDVYNAKAIEIGKRCSDTFSVSSLGASADALYDAKLPGDIKNALFASQTSLADSAEQIKSINAQSRCHLF